MTYNVFGGTLNLAVSICLSADNIITFVLCFNPYVGENKSIIMSEIILL